MGKIIVQFPNFVSFKPIEQNILTYLKKLQKIVAIFFIVTKSIKTFGVLERRVSQANTEETDRRMSEAMSLNDNSTFIESFFFAM